MTRCGKRARKAGVEQLPCSRPARRARRRGSASQSAIAASRAARSAYSATREHGGRARRRAAARSSACAPGLSEPTATTSTPRGRGRGRGSPAGSCRRPRRGRRPSCHLQLREAAAGGAQRAGRRAARRRARAPSSARRCDRRRRSAAGRRRSTCATTFERPPRRISTARVRPTSGCGARHDVEDRLVELAGVALGGRPVRELRRPRPRTRAAAAAARAPAPGRRRRSTGPSGAGAERSPKWRRIPSRRHAVALDPRPHRAVLAPAHARALLGRRAAERERAAVPRARRPGPATRSGADGRGWTTPARARWPTIARTDLLVAVASASSIRCTS